MMSLGKVIDASSAAEYYGEVDDYYFKGQAPTTWLGDGALRLGLTGEVDKNAFTALLRGEMQDGSQLRIGGDGSRRAATDLTFSAPKSVSLQALVGGDVRLLEAHHHAVVCTIQYIEKEVAGYRQRSGNVIERRDSGNLIVAAIRHDVSRGIDPQLHTHCVTLNATQTATGNWRALDQTLLYQQQKLFGALYRSQLAMEVQKLGYSIRTTTADGRFELAHIADKQIQAFSSRSADIEAELAKQGKTRANVSAHQKEKIALFTRKAKGEVHHAEILASWKIKSRELGINYAPELVPREYTSAECDVAAHTAMSYGLEHTMERQSVVQKHKLLQAAIENGTGKTNIQSVQVNLTERVLKNEVIRSGERYTTRYAQQLEREMLGLELRGRKATAPLMSAYEATRKLAGCGLNAGQKAAVMQIISTENRVTGVQGVAGSGKTTMLKQANLLATLQGYKMEGLAASSVAVNQLKSQASMPSRTISSFLHAETHGLTRKSIVVIDEASMVGTQDMHQILYKVEAVGARAVLIGDTRQLKAVRAGQPFSQLQAHGMVAVKMADIVRQRDAVLRHAVELAGDGNIRGSIDALKKHVIEIDYTRDRHVAMAEDFGALDTRTQDATLLVTGTRDAKSSLNREVRRVLGLAGRGAVINVLDSRDFTDAQRINPRTYQVGDVVQAERHYPSLHIRRGDIGTVVNVSRTTVTFQRADGELVDWHPRNQPNFTAYTEQAREFSVGEKIRFTKNDHSLNIINGDTGIVTSIEPENQRVTVQLHSHDSVTLSTEQPLHFDHGYASTVHSAQGQSCERAMIDADTTSVMANEAQYYVAISRAKDEVTLYTDDRVLLPEVMERADLKESALDLQSDHEMIKNKNQNRIAELEL